MVSEATQNMTVSNLQKSAPKLFLELLQILTQHPSLEKKRALRLGPELAMDPKYGMSSFFISEMSPLSLALEITKKCACWKTP